MILLVRFLHVAGMPAALLMCVLNLHYKKCNDCENDNTVKIFVFMEENILLYRLQVGQCDFLILNLVISFSDLLTLTNTANYTFYIILNIINCTCYYEAIYTLRIKET